VSSTADVLHDLDGLLKAVAELMATETIKALPQLARDLGAERQVNQAIDGLLQALMLISKGLLLLRQQVLQADALVAIAELVPPLVATLDRAVRETSTDLARAYGFTGAAATAQSLAGGIGRASLALDEVVGLGAAAVEAAGGEGWLPIAGALKQMEASVQALRLVPATATPTAVPAQ